MGPIPGVPPIGNHPGTQCSCGFEGFCRGDYDANGNRTQTKLPDGRLTRHTYDALNRLTRTEFPDGSSHTISYRPDGRKAAETDPRGTTSTYGYDAKGQLTSVVQSGVQTPTAYTYDEQGAKTKQTDALGREVSWAHDAAGRPISRTLPDGARESFQYDLEGQLIAKTSFGGQRIQSTYDAMGRELTRVIPASADTPARTIAWTYDAEGRRLTQTEGGPTSAQGTTTYRYDAKGRLIEQQTPQGTLSWAYDDADRIAERSTAQGTTRYAYDGDGRMTRLTAPDGKTTTYGHDAAGRLVQSVQQLSAGIELITQRRYDAQDRQTAVAHSKRTSTATTLLAGQAISRGVGGVVGRIDTYGEQASFNDTTSSFTGSPNRIQVFGYDANARLTGEAEYKGAQIAPFLANPQAPATQATTYGYDPVGNRTTKTVTTAAGTETTSYAYDSNDRLTSETLTTSTGSSVTTVYTWDGNGNLQSKTSPGEYTGYVFDADNRLVEVKRGASGATATSVARYGYDADGQRIRRTTGGATTQYLIDPTTTWPQVVLESQGAQRTAYTWGDTLRQQSTVSAGSPTEALVPLPGHLGTTLAATDSQGSVVERYETTAFGELDKLTPKLNHQYTGEYWEPQARMTYLRARWYDPAAGRLPSLDPATGKATDARSLNRYGYGHNDPLHVADPSGSMGMGEMSIAMDIMSTLAVSAIRDIGMDMVMGQVGKTLISAFGSVHTVGNWGGHPGGAALVSILANLCYFNERACLLRGIPTLANGVEMPATTLHIMESLSGEAQTRFGPGRALPFLLGRVPSQGRAFLDLACPKKRPPGMACDEYPYSSTLQGGPVNYMAGGVSARLVPKLEQDRQWILLGRFYRAAQVDRGGITPSSLFLNAVTPLPSFFIDRAGKKHQL